MVKKTACLLMCVLAASVLHAKKPRIAIADFANKSGASARVGEGVADMLATSLVKIGKYDVFERQQMSAMLEEQKLGMSGLVTPESAAKIGKLLGVQYVIIGSINQFGQKEGGGAAFGIGLKTQTARVAADIRIVSVESGKITAAGSGQGEETAAGVSIQNADLLPTDVKFGSRGFDETIIGKATRKCVDKLVDEIGKVFGSLGAEGKIVRVQDGKVYINLGKDSGIAVGQVFEVMRKGEEMVDPDTGESLGSEDTRVGMVRVTEIREKFCIAEITDGRGKIAQNDIAIMKK